MRELKCKYNVIQTNTLSLYAGQIYKIKQINIRYSQNGDKKLFNSILDL